MFGKYTTEPTEIADGVQYYFMFDDIGTHVSVVKHKFSYGGIFGLYGLALIDAESGDFIGEPRGFLTAEEVERILIGLEKGGI